MKIMIYLLVDLFNYRQLTRLRRESLPTLEKRLTELCAGKKTRVIKSHEGTVLIECGREEELNARACASFALQIHGYLTSVREELFGFIVLIGALPPEDPVRIEEKMKRLASRVERGEELWLSEPAVRHFSVCLSAESNGEVARVTAARNIEARRDEEEETRRVWVREGLVQRVLDSLTPRLNGCDDGKILFLHGPSGAGKTAILLEAAQRLGLGGRKAPLLRLFTLFRRRSSIHPFINSLQPSLLRETPKYLQGPEVAVWNEMGGLLAYLHGAEVSTNTRQGSFFPDQLQEDFTVGYQLYLLAFVRMTASLLLPAIIACEGLESYHPSARRLVARLIGELLAYPNFIPVLSSTMREIPEELSAFDIDPFYVHPLGEREIRTLSRHFFPGLELPPTEIRRLKHRAGRLFTPVVSYLQYIRKTGGIRDGENGFQWVQSAVKSPALPSNPLSVSWLLIKSMSKDTLVLLYALHLAAGLLDRNGLLAFLFQSGFERASVEKSLEGLITYGLVADEELLIPALPALRRKLEELLGPDGEKLRADFISYLFSLWKRGEFPRRVLLFSFLARAGRTDLALQVLPEVIRRKIEERDLAGARIFCDTGRLDFSLPLDDQQKEDLLLISTAGKLRAAVAEGKLEEALALCRTLSPPGRVGMRGEPAGDAALALAVCLLARGDGNAALEDLKAALLRFQETGFERGKRGAYHLLGLAMLGCGKTREAIEYLDLSERLCVEAGDSLGALRSTALLGVCQFLEGRLTQCLQTAERGEEAARSMGQREQELFLRFLRARGLFQLGLYGECSLSLQACLCAATLYSAGQAQAVMSAWLGRSILYQGDVACAVKYLEKLDQTREVLFFLAEGALFSENLENASLYGERSLAAKETAVFPPPEGVSWRDGFCSMEGRCFRLGREDAFLKRNTRALIGCLLGMRGFSREAIRDLRSLSRGEGSAENDPNAYLNAYLYSLVLPEYASEDEDDKVTILSKSLKGLQERVSRIESPGHKNAFLGLNYWNHRIMDEARLRKLM
jgi:tetratricopeptide (TPR) repeat protein